MPAFRGPDGRVIYVPEEQASGLRADTNYREVGSAEAGAAANRIAPTDNGVLGSIGATVSGALSGATLGASDWLLKGALDKGQFEQLAQDRADNPILSGTAQTAGMMLPALVTGGAATPAGALGRVAAEGIETGRATGGALGIAQQLGAAGGEGAIANAGIYLSDVALGDRKLTAEGINGALGTGLLFGAAGVPVAHGIEAGAIAARRMFARYAEGGAGAADAATAAWTEKAQRHLEAFDQAAELAQGKLAEAQTAREAANLQRLRATAEMADARAFTPPAEFPGAPDPAPVPPGTTAETAAPAVGAAAEPPEIAQARALRDRAASLGGEPITPGELPPGAPGVRRTYVIPGERPPARPNAIEQLAQQPGVTTEGPATLARTRGIVGPPVTADEAELGARLGEYQAARRSFDKLHAQVDPDLDAILRGVQPGDVQRLPVPVGEFDTGAVGTPPRVPSDATGIGTRVLRPQGTPADVSIIKPSQDLTAPFDIDKTPLRFDAERRQYFNMDVAAEPMGGTPPARSLGEVAAEQSPVPILGPEPQPWSPAGLRHELAVKRDRPDLAMAQRDALLREAEAKTPAERAAAATERRRIGAQIDELVAQRKGSVPAQEIVQRGIDGPAAAAPSDQLHIGLPDSARIAGRYGKGTAPLPEGEVPNHAALDRYLNRTGKDYSEATLPARAVGERGYYEPPGGGTDAVRVENARKAIADGQREPIELGVSAEGKIMVTGGRHRLAAAIEADAPIKVKWSTSTEPAEHDVFRGGARATNALGADDAALAAPSKNPKRVEAAKKAAAAGAERRREIHSAVAGNLPQELQSTWDKEGYRFMQEEAPRIIGEKDPINAASNISEAFAEKYGSAGEAGRGYEGDRFHRRAEIEAKHAESWAKEQERKYYSEAKRPHAELALIAKSSKRSIEDLTELFEERAAVHEFEGGKPRVDAERLALDEVANAVGGTSEHAATDTLTGQLRGMQSKLGAGGSLVEMGEPAREAYRAAKAERTSEAAAHFRGEAIAAREARAGAVAAGETPNPFHEPAAAGGGAEADQFFRNLNTPKTRDAYVAANIGRAMREEGSHAAALAKVEREWAARGGHPLDVKRLEMAHDAALERAASAADPAERAAAAQEAQRIEKQITQVGARPGAVEDIAAIAPAVTRVEKAAAALTEALGDAAPAAAKEHATAFRAAEDEASRKTVARIGQAADDAAAGRAAAQSRDPLAPAPRPADDLLLGPSQKQQRIAAAQKGQREAGAAYAKARVAEAEAQIGAKQAAGAAAAERAKLGPPPKAAAATAGRAGIGHRVVQGAHVVGFAADLASDVGIPGVPRPHDIPVIGPMLSAYLKYRALKAAAGRFMGRVPATAETQAAALAARTRDGIARAVDRSLGLIERNTNTIRAALTVGTLKATAALSGRLVDDGGPDAPAKASVSEQAAVRMREVAAVIADPSLVHDAIRAQGRALTDPDLIDALSSHLLTMFQRLNEVAPKGPPPNPFTGKQWTPSPAEAIRFGQQVAIARDPQVAFQMLEAGTLTPTGADTLRACYQLLFRDGQARLVQRAAELKNPVDYSQLVRLGRLFDLPLIPSQDPQHVAVLAGAHTPAAKPAPAASAPGASPTPSIAGSANISNLYQPSGERAQR